MARNKPSKGTKGAKGAKDAPPAVTDTGAVGAAIPAKLLKPFQETPLNAAFAAGQVGGPALIGVGLAVGAPPVLANLMYNLGYSTVEEALGVLKVAKREFARRFNLAGPLVEAFVQTLTALAKPIPDEVRTAIASQPFTFGLAIEHAHRPLVATDNLATLSALKTPPAPPVDGGGLIGFGAPGAGVPIGLSTAISSTLPPAVDLRGELPNPVRYQGLRNTCVAHSCLVAYEHYLMIATRDPKTNPNGTRYDMSEQFLFWACKHRDKIPTDPSGTLLTAAADAFGQAGVCQESDWKYVPDNTLDRAGNPAHDECPTKAKSEAAHFRATQVIRIAPTAVDDYKRVLASGRCAAFAVPCYNSFWQSENNRATGKITLPMDNEVPNGGHAMCMVGYQDDASIPALGGGRFILRNSHGTAFGALSPYGPGHGTIPYAYIAKYGLNIGVAFM